MLKEQLGLLIPQMILGGGALLVMLSIAVKRNHKTTSVLAALVFAAAAVALKFVDYGAGEQVTTLFLVDGFSIFMNGLILIAALFITVFAYPYYQKEDEDKEEFYILLVLSVLGATMMTVSNHFISFFLSLELLSIPMYVLVGYMKKTTSGVEAGIKYLILASVSSAILLFGFALIYALLGEMQLDKISTLITSEVARSGFFIGGIAMVIVGLGFKLALVPFHMWTPDIYSGTSAPVSAYVATISKGSVFAFLLRFFFNLNPSTSSHSSVWIAFAVIAVASMLIGNWTALRQQNIKRLLAYSSIGHLGYLIVALLAVSQAGVEASIFYLVTYFTAMLAAFGMVSYLSEKGRELYNIDDYRGLVWEKPLLGTILTVVMLSLAGIPLTAGFLGKFYILLSGVGSAEWLLVIVLVVSSGIGLFYYLRVVVAMFAKRSETAAVAFKGTPSVSGGIVLAILVVLVVWFGTAPEGLISLISNLVGTF